MPRPLKKTFVLNNSIASASNTLPTTGASLKLTQGFPTGNALLHSLKLRLSGNLNLTTSAPGAIVQRGGLQAVRGLWLSTPQHGVLVNGLDARTIGYLNYIASRIYEVQNDVADASTGTPTYEYGLELPFRDFQARRPVDTSLDLFRVSYMELALNIGTFGDFISGGTYSTGTVQVMNLEVHADIDPGGPEGIPDLPAFKPYLDILKIPVNQTQTGFQVILPYGGRIIKDYFVQQVNGSTLAELDNTIVGANDTDRISFLVGGYPWVNRIEWLALQNDNVKELRLGDGLPTGSAVLSWARRDTVGYMANELLGLNSLSGASPQTEINVDSTSVANGQLWISTRCLMGIPVDAERPKAQAPANGA